MPPALDELLNFKHTSRRHRPWHTGLASELIGCSRRPQPADITPPDTMLLRTSEFLVAPPPIEARQVHAREAACQFA